jgi:apolipoprotein N-acyltransferase
MTEVWDFLAAYLGVGVILVGVIAYTIKSGDKANRALKLAQKNDEKIHKINIVQTKIETDLNYIKAQLARIEDKLNK